MVCLCKYHNWVTQGAGSLLNLVGPTPTRRYHDCMAPSREILKILSLDCWKWHFQSLLYLFGIMICESKLSVIIEIITLDMVFKFKNFFDLPPVSIG
jgi:hypothetical protein